MNQPRYRVQVCLKDPDKADIWLESYDDYMTTVNQAAGFISNPEYTHVEFVLILKGTVRKGGIPSKGETLAALDRSENVRDRNKTIDITGHVMVNKWMEEGLVEPDKAAKMIVYPSPFPQPDESGSLCVGCKPTAEQLAAM